MSTSWVTNTPPSFEGFISRAVITRPRKIKKIQLQVRGNIPMSDRVFDAKTNVRLSLFRRISHLTLIK